MTQVSAHKKHPPGLYVLCVTEAGERFGFYLLAALLLLWLTEQMGWSSEAAMSLSAWYKFCVYLSPFLGGIFADRIYGYCRSVLTGAALLGVGYLSLGWVQHSRPLLYCALTVLVLGNGLFKPNISTLVGNLYPQGDPRRDGAFSLFYMGINVGALLAPLVGEWMHHSLGWRAAFACAAGGMVASLIIFSAGRSTLAVADRRSSVGAIIDVPLDPDYEDRPDSPQVERQRIIALIIMSAIMMIFWMAFYQNDTSLVLFARDNTDRVVWGWEIPTGLFNSVNPSFILLVTPPLAWLLAGYLRRRGLEPSTPTKILTGMLLTVAAYGVMVLACHAGGNTGRVSLLWLVASYFVITVAEVFVSPMGLSMVTKLAPRRMTAMLMGLWFLSTAVGAWFAGKIGAWLWNQWPHSQFFGIFLVLALLAALVLVTQHRRLVAAIPRDASPDELPAQLPSEAVAVSAAAAG